MGSLFGRPRAPPRAPASSPSPALSSHDAAVLELKRQRDRLHRYSLRLDSVIEEETALARSLLSSGAKDKATAVLRRRRYQQRMRASVEGHLENLERTADSIEWAAVSASVFAALERGKTALERMNAELSVERVEQLMAESEEAVEQQRSVEALLGGPALSAASLDAEVDEELRRMEDEEAQSAPLTAVRGADVEAAAIAELPSPPTRPPVPVQVPVKAPTVPARRKAEAVAMQ